MGKAKPLVKWDSPPPEKVRPDWAAIAAEIRAGPAMVWAEVFNGNYSTAHAAIRGNVAAVHGRLGFEFRTGNSKRGFHPDTGKEWRTCTLWIRFNPAKADPTSEAIKEARKK